jgi:hypothetical protein
MQWWLVFFTSLVGGGAAGWIVVYGLSKHLGDRWLETHKSELQAKVQEKFEAYKDTLERKRKRLEAELGHGVYVTQARFDTSSRW